MWINIYYICKIENWWHKQKLDFTTLLVGISITYLNSGLVWKVKTMASGVTLQESEQKNPEGFFPKLYENVCKTMTEKNLDEMPDVKDPNEKFIR